jgi:cytochrome c556
MKRFVVLGVAGVAVWATGAMAQGAATGLQPDDIIAVRQALMDLQQGNANAMKAAVDSGADVKPLTFGAKALVASTHMIPSLFPAGTEKGHKTRAKPEIWSDRAGFEKAAANATAQAEKLVQLADANDKAGFATQFQQLGQACGACHRPYRSQ